jgi:hypothetical protein
MSELSLLRKEKSVGDLKAVYAGLENDSFDSKPILQKAKSEENTHSRGLSNGSVLYVSSQHRFHTYYSLVVY